MKRFLPVFLAVIITSICNNSSLAGEVDLLNTIEATSDMGWYMEPSDGWMDVSTNVGDNDFRSLQVCRIRKRYQNNWLRTPYIPVGEANGIFIEMRFTIRSCGDLQYVSSCKETFNLYYLEADSEDEGEGKPLTELVYTQVDTIAAKQRFEPGGHVRDVTNIEHRVIGPFTKKGIFVAFQDTGACMSLLQVRIYFKTCDRVVENLAVFPRTITGAGIISLIPVSGECVVDAAWTLDNKGPINHCNSEGVWNLINGSCRCREGYHPNPDFTKCLECPVGRFKSSMGNDPCSTCPDNSMSVKKASTHCICSPGYYRASTDEPGSPCTKSPSSPVDLVASVNKTRVVLDWEAPVFNGGRSDVTYSVSCQECDDSYELCSECGPGVDYYPKKSNLERSSISVEDLSPHTNYKFKVYARNGVSDLSRKPEKYAVVTLKTNSAAPSTINKIHVVKVTDTSAKLSWERPELPNGKIDFFEVYWRSTGVFNGARIVRSNKTTGNYITITNLPPATSFVAQVRAKNAAGYGLLSSPTAFRTTGTKPSVVTSSEPDFQFEILDTESEGLTDSVSGSQLHLVIGIAVACSLLILVLALLLFMCGKKKKTQKTPMDYPAFINTLDLVNTRKTYVDPSTYEDPEQAVHEFANEIHSSFVKIEQVIGSGEFGEVCKGILRPPTPIGEDKPFASSPQQRTVVAIKTLKSGYSTQQKRDFLSEASIMGQFNHPHVIRLEGVITKNRPYMIVTEFMENGSLDSFLQNVPLLPPVIRLVEMLRDIACGMRYLADMGYVHRDLAARNILVDSNLICKVSDFGLSRVLENVESEGTAMYTTRGGMIPIRWTAPEAIIQRTFTSASDVWSYGIVIWEVLSKGERPYWEMSNQDVLQCVECGYRLPPPPFCPLYLHGVMLDCWNKDRGERPTFTDLMVSMDNCLRDPHCIQKTINNIPAHQQFDCIPETLDLSSLGQWLEGMNLTHNKEKLLRHGCVTADQIIRISSSQLSLMGIIDEYEQDVVLEGAEQLRRKLEQVHNMGIAV